MAAYRQVYDSRHLQADCQELGTLRSVIKYGLPIVFYSIANALRYVIAQHVETGDQHIEQQFCHGPATNLSKNFSGKS